MNCEHCKKPIRDGEEFYWTADECALHEACYPKKEFIADADREEAERKRRETK